jgi:hypothetical protein
MTVDPATGLSGGPASVSEPAPRRGVVALLVISGGLCAVLSVFYLGLYLGGVPFPIVIVLSAVLNLLLVAAMRTETGSLGRAALPLVAWGVVFLLCLAGGPGGDQVVVADWRILLLPVAALAPAGVYLFSVRIKEISRAVRPPEQRP